MGFWGWLTGYVGEWEEFKANNPEARRVIDEYYNTLSFFIAVCQSDKDFMRCREAYREGHYDYFYDDFQESIPIYHCLVEGGVVEKCVKEKVEKRKFDEALDKYRAGTRCLHDGIKEFHISTIDRTFSQAEQRPILLSKSETIAYEH